MSHLLLIVASCLLSLVGANLLSAEVVDTCKLLSVNTKILVPGSCIDWAECSYDGEVIDEGTCLQGWYFDTTSGKCNKSTHVVCPFSIVSKSPCATAKTGTFLPHPELCTGFIYCKNGAEQYSSCPDGLNFEPSSQSCVYPNIYTCPAQEGNSADNAICMSVSENIRMPDPSSCAGFRQCSKGILKSTQCITGTYFNRLTGRCGPVEESDCVTNNPNPELPSTLLCGTDELPIVGFISDDKTCSGYFYCDEMENGKADRNPVRAKCDDGKFFDGNLFSCKDRVNVQCLYDRCEGMGNKFANIQGDCSKYTYCKDGVTQSMGSCPDNYYFDEKTQSCTKKLISYMACMAF